MMKMSGAAPSLCDRDEHVAMVPGMVPNMAFSQEDIMLPLTVMSTKGVEDCRVGSTLEGKGTWKALSVSFMLEHRRVRK